MRRIAHGAQSRDRGAAAVEFAIVLPLLLLIVGGVVDFGRAFYTQVTLTNAAREGARVAVVGTTAGLVEDRALAAIPAGPLRAATSVVGGSCSIPNDPVSIEVSAPFDWIILQPMMNLFGAGDTLPSTLSSSATMRCGG